MPFLFTILTIALTIGAVIDIVRREDSQVRFLPRLVWLIIVILLPLLGALLWFGLGREYGDAGIALPRLRRSPRTAPSTGTTAPPAPPRDTRTTEQQIADLDREIEEWRLREEIEKRKHQPDERGEQGRDGV